MCLRNAPKFQDYNRTNYSSKLVNQMEVELLMLVPETADGFRATIGALSSLGDSEL
jgi:hypothetical protein